MKFSEIVDHASELLRQKGRMMYRALKLEFALTDDPTRKTVYHDQLASHEALLHHAG